jgi:DNA repair protein RecN (Recombination protein N)
VLRELHISGLGVIEDLDLEFSPGLNILTGETGAGKTMVTVGLQLALGRRGSSSMVRKGAGSAKVQARFDAPARAVSEGWSEDGEIVLARTVSTEGRSTARVSGQLAPVSALAELAAELVEVHGQHEGRRLLSTTAQTAFLDRYAGAEHRSAVDALGTEHERLSRARSVLAQLDERERDRERQMDLLGYQVREIETASPRVGETQELKLEEARLAHAERLLERASAAERALAEEDGAADALRVATSELQSSAEIDPSAGELAERAFGLAAAAAELVIEIRAYREGLDLDQGRLEEVRERIAALGALQRKYGGEEAEVLAFLERASEELRSLAGAEHERERVASEVAELTDRVSVLAAVVSDGRATAAPRLAGALADELVELGMQGSSIEVTLVPNPELVSAGAERTVFVFSGGPGQPAQPLSKVASGGELSRAMLACRSVLLDLDDVPTLIFDEVDAGIGGLAGVAVGRRLAALAGWRQVVVVSHLPQIASFADRHIRVRKESGAASVEVLDDRGRVAELSRMLAGLPGSGSAAAHAEELLAEAARERARVT